MQIQSEDIIEVGVVTGRRIKKVPLRVVTFEWQFEL